jgi:8-oxo-dGTP pyrophosphatase MutT (NUDIX family)
MTEAVKTSPRAMSIERDLRSWRPRAGGQDSLRREYLDFLRTRGATALDREGGRAHVTASCFVLTPDLANILLCFHKKGQFWVQLGGHIEPDDRSVAAAAFREAIEESGILDLEPISVLPLDVDRHDLGPGFTDCDTHWDIGFGATVAHGAVPVASQESEAVRWWPVGSLPAEVPHGFGQRLNRIIDAARSASLTRN